MACASVAGLSGGGDHVPAGMRRSRSEPQLRRAVTVPRAIAAPPPSRMKSSRSNGMFPVQVTGGILPVSVRSASMFEDDYSAVNRRVGLLDSEESEAEEFKKGIGKVKRANWVERILELKSRWPGRQHQDDDGDGDDDNVVAAHDYVCGVGYESEEEEEWDQEKFSRLLTRATWTETTLFSQLVFLCNLAYVIPDIKADDLIRYFDLRFVTSSLERKSAAAVAVDLSSDSPGRPPSSPPPPSASSEKRRSFRPSVAYDIAASAATYVHSRTKGLLSFASPPASSSPPNSPHSRVYKSEVAAIVTTSTMTAVVAAAEEARHEAARDLRTLQSSPCQWFVCDEPAACIRCFIIQGSDSVASWQANLFFEPAKFEGLDVMVHRGIYEAAKGIYEQFMPEIESHLHRHGDRARFRFTGHSLGGSLSILVSLMLLARGVLPRAAVLPVITFGSPSVFCGGRRVLDELGLDDNHVLSVMMHRDIVPRAFSCNYPGHVTQVLKRLNSAFRSHPCLIDDKLLYSPLGQTYILQPEDKSSPRHPLLPRGAALYVLDRKGSAPALRAFLNSPHPLETLSNPAAYGTEGTILRDHDSSNYLKAVNGLVQQHSMTVVRKSRRKRLREWLPLLTMPISKSWGSHHHPGLENSALSSKEMASSV